MQSFFFFFLQLDHVLFTLLYKLFSFISIGEVFSFRHKVYVFFLSIILNIKFIIWYNLLQEYEENGTLRAFVWIEGRGRGSRVELAKNMLILGQFYSTLLYFPSILTDHKAFHNSVGKLMGICTKFSNLRDAKIEKNICQREIITHKIVFTQFGNLPMSMELQGFHYSQEKIQSAAV